MVKGFPSRKDSIILAVIDIINESGVQGLSTKEIAAKQGISESLLYKHFKSLDEVLVAVIQYYSRFDTMIMNTVQNKGIFHVRRKYLSLQNRLSNYMKVISSCSHYS